MLSHTFLLAKQCKSAYKSPEISSEDLEMLQMVPVSSKSSGKENLGPIIQPMLPESLTTLFLKKKKNLSLLPNEE